VLFSGRVTKKIFQSSIRIVVILNIISLIVSLSPVQAEVAGAYARHALHSAFARSVNTNHQPAKAQDFAATRFEDPSRNADRVTHFRLCPRHLSLYVGEAYTLVPVPLGTNNEVVHGVATRWSANDPNVATVTSLGEVEAIAPGHTLVTVQAGTGRATVAVEVREGARRRQSDLEFDLEHAGDCNNPEAISENGAQADFPENYSAPNDQSSVAENSSIDSLSSTQPTISKPQKGDDGQIESPPVRNGRLAVSERTEGQSFSKLARLAVLRVSKKDGRGELVPVALRAAAASTAATTKKIFGRGLFYISDPIDGSSGDPFSAAATAPYNAVGSPRFAPQEDSKVGAAKTKNALGSYSFQFTAPILGLGGRGIGTELGLVYNSRLWEKNASSMTFNYNKGWPAAGWSIGYGRIIQNYDNTGTGDQSGSGSSNAPGNYLLVQPDGSRIFLQQYYDSQFGRWLHKSTDGTFIQFNTVAGKLRYPDGTLVKYDMLENNRLLPKSIRTRNGDQTTISYKTFVKDQQEPNNFKYRWAINTITDSLGRIIQFHYYGEKDSNGDVVEEYKADEANGRPDDALAAITVPDFGGSTNRTLVKLYYQNITLTYNFSLTVDSTSNPASGSTLTVLKRIYFPSTGTGYLFPDYSNYGMIRYISVRNNMTGAAGTVTDGTEIAYTKYTFQETGTLSDSPQYTTRSEWWQGKTDDNGNPTSSPTNYNYSRTLDNGLLTETDTVTYPNGLQVDTVSDNNPSSFSYGKVLYAYYKDGATILREMDYTYTTPADGGIQLSQVITIDDAQQKAKVSYDFGSYGRVTNFYEYGFKAGTWTVKRRTAYQYSDDANYLALNLLRLVTEVDVYDAGVDNDNANDVLKAKTVYILDNYALKGGMEYYGLTSTSYPPNHEASFDQNNIYRGNVTGVQTFSSVSPAVSSTRYTKFDIFGNAVNADVSCCQVKNFAFNSSNYWSQRVSTTDGTAGVVPFLTTNYQYDFSTGLVTQTTDPSNLTTSFGYDGALRVLTVTAPSGAVTTTTPDRDANGNDQLAYSQQISYTENASNKVITNKSWFNGAGNVLRSGIGAGSAPTSFDTVATVYDSMGRMAKQSNPYAGDASGIGTGQCSSNPYPYLCWTTTAYDKLSRVTQVTLPDNQTVVTSYSGSTVTVTDQVGRQRKSTADGLGRMTSVVEQNPSTGVPDPLNYQTTYSYDVLDNLIQVNQGDQLRTFVYDALSRSTSQTTPEAGTVTFTYNDASEVLRRTDARGVETHYKYDSLNRPVQVWYTGVGGDDAGTIRPALPSGIAATSDVTINYNNYTSSQSGNGQVNQVTDQAGNETYVYDSLARLLRKTRVIDAQSYQTEYLYNTANQVTTLIYPSGKRVRTNHDSRGRTSGLDKVDSSGNVLGNYMTSIGYNTAGQVTSVALPNGVNEAYGYSADRLQLTSQTATKGSTLMSLTYSYSGLGGTFGTGTTAGNTGQLVSITGTINNQSRNQGFAYDNVGRLLSATGWSAWTRRFAYDRWGNRTGMWDALSGGNQLHNIAIATTGGVANNRIANVNLVNYSYDASGNCTNDGAHSYAYDGEGRQANVDSGTTATNVYDSNNWRVKKVAGGGTIHYVWEGAHVIAEYDGSTGALISEYIFGGGRMVGRDQSGVLRYYHQDRLSTRLITDGSGLVMGTEDHLAFGEDAGTTGETEKHRFTNYERDSESASDYAVNRQYHTATGRFLRPDPVGGNIADPQSLNRYVYTSNDPINLVDPDGQLLAFPILTGLINFFDSLFFSYIVNVSAGGSSIDPIFWGGGGGGQQFRQGPLWTNASKAKQDRVAYIVQKTLANQGCRDWFQAHSQAIGHGADLPKLLQKTGLNFYLAGDKDRVSLNGLEGLHTNKFGTGEGFGETLFGGSPSPQIVINRSVLDDLNDPDLAVQLIHELFHAAGFHQGSNPSYPIIGRNNDQNPEVKWKDIEKNCKID
jgi:RHS repeat-associated protein